MIPSRLPSLSWNQVARSPAAEAIQAARAPWDTPLRPIFVDEPGERLAASVRAEWHPLRELMLMQLAFLAERAGEP